MICELINQLSGYEISDELMWLVNTDKYNTSLPVSCIIMIKLLMKIHQVICFL